MRRGRVLAAAVATAALTLTVLPADAATIPDDLEYTYTLNQPLIGKVESGKGGSCTQTQGDDFTLSVSAGLDAGLTAAITTPDNDIMCTVTMTRNFSGTTLTGTVRASGAGQSGAGTFTLVCEASQAVTSWFHLLVAGDGMPSLAADPYGVDGTGYVSCLWTIAISDAAKSNLSGTLEMYGDFSNQSTQVDCATAGITTDSEMTHCVGFDMTINAYLTGATGAYAGRTGEGEMVQRVYAPITIPISLTTDPGGGGNGGGGQLVDLTGCQYSATQPPNPTGWQNFPARPTNVSGWQGVGYYNCSGGGGGGGGGFDFSMCEFSQTEQIGSDWFNIPGMPQGAINWSGPGWYRCATNPFTGQPVTAVINRQLLRSAFSAVLSGNLLNKTLSLSTKKNQTGAVRFASPARTSASTTRDFGVPRGVAKAPSVRISTVPGATCTVSATKGSKSTTLASRKSALGGKLDTSVTAAQLRTSLGAKVGDTAKVTATCTVPNGKTTKALPAASITVKFV